MSAVIIDAATGQTTTRPLTDAELAQRQADQQAAATLAAQQQQAATDASTTRTLVVQTAQTAVGVNITALTAAQVRALLAVLMAKAGALNPDGTVRPLGQWA